MSDRYRIQVIKDQVNILPNGEGFIADGNVIIALRRLAQYLGYRAIEYPDMLELQPTGDLDDYCRQREKPCSESVDEGRQ